MACNCRCRAFDVQTSRSAAQPEDPRPGARRSSSLRPPRLLLLLACSLRMQHALPANQRPAASPSRLGAGERVHRPALAATSTAPHASRHHHYHRADLATWRGGQAVSVRLWRRYTARRVARTRAVAAPVADGGTHVSSTPGVASIPTPTLLNNPHEIPRMRQPVQVTTRTGYNPYEQPA